MKYVIAGFGKFGRLAFDRLREAFPDRRLIVVEKVNNAEGLDEPGNWHTFRGDAVSFLVEEPGIEDEDVVIPMVPFHLTAAYLRVRLPEMEPITIPKEIAARVPNPFPVDDANLCCSLADFICPDDCPEGDHCTVTGEPRPKPLYRLIEELDVPGFELLVQRSSQILPGVGGYEMGDLRRLARSISSSKIVIATSCRCHAILSAIGVRDVRPLA
jgi:hypothetical protein